MRKNRVTYRNLSCNVKGWELFLSKEQYEEYQELLQLRSRVSCAFDQMVRRCEDINKLRRLYKRYKEYYDELPF